MKKTAEIKYPNSANLFQFCRKVLDHKFGGIRVIDQDVGQILGFDPADCSHWKKGKKNIRSIQAMKSIAEHLGVDEKLVVDIASGEIEDTEAFFEFSGYGMFKIDTKLFDGAKKDFYRKNASVWTNEKESEFRSSFDVNEEAIDKIVADIHTKINFQEAPLYLPEVVSHYADLNLVAKETGIAEPKSVEIRKIDAKTEIAYRAGTEMRPFMRFRIAKAMANYFLTSIQGNTNDEEYSQHLKDVQSNLFAAKLLTPATLIQNEMQQVSVSKDIVTQLAETFWVSKTFMNRRLKNVLTSI